MDDFGRECREAARNLRRVNGELRRELASSVRDEVAVPLAARIAQAATGPHARILSAGTKARAGAQPTIVVGGTRPRLTGGAGPRDVVFGDEFGGGSRITAIPRTARRRGYRKHTTRQFKRSRPFVFPTIGKAIPDVLDTYADVVTGLLRKVVN